MLEYENGKPLKPNVKVRIFESWQDKHRDDTLYDYYAGSDNE